MICSTVFWILEVTKQMRGSETVSELVNSFEAIFCDTTWDILCDGMTDLKIVFLSCLSNIIIWDYAFW